MTDIVERLRHEMMPAAMSATRRAILEEAAAEIERLRAVLQKIIVECYTLDNDVAFRVGNIVRRALEPKP